MISGVNIKVTPAPPHKPSRMPMEHRLFLRALQGLRDGEAMRLLCDDLEDVIPTVRVIRSFIDRMVKSGRIHNHFAVLKREEEGNLIIYVIKKQGREYGNL